LLLTLQTISHKSSLDKKPSQVGETTKQKQVLPHKKPSFYFNRNSPFELFQKLLKEKSDCIEKSKFQNIVTIENDFFLL